MRPLLAAALMLPALGAGGADAAPSRSVVVVVGAEPGRVAAAERAVAGLGGRVERRLPVVRGFTARVPRRAVERLRDARSVAFVSRDATLRLSSEPPADGAIEPPPAEIPADQPAEQVAEEVLADAGADAAAGQSLAPDPVAPGEDVPLSEFTTPVTLDGADGAVRARASMDAVRGGAGVAGSGTGAGVDVALIDSGVVGVPALASGGRLVRGADFSEDAADPDLNGLDAFGHGTHLAGLIAADDPATGFTSVAPGARLVSVKVAGADGLTSLVRILVALDWVRRHQHDGGLDIRVLNLSLGVEQRGSYVREPLAHAVEQLWQRGIVVVAAAGNQAGENGALDLPAADPFVVAVGATDPRGTAAPADDAVADFSSRDAVRPPDVVAPGRGAVSLRVAGSTLDEEFPAARIGTDFFRGSGTSQAAAVVSGVVARLLQARPDLEPDQVKALLRRGAAGLGAPEAAQGAGRVDAAASAGLPTPDAGAVAQKWQRAVLDLPALWRVLQDEAAGVAPDVAAGEGAMAGRRWTGRRWTGRRWSGAAWSDGG
jgi:serine protease AprX